MLGNLNAIYVRINYWTHEMYFLAVTGKRISCCEMTGLENVIRKNVDGKLI